MRILHVIPSVSPASGGPAQAVRTIMRAPVNTQQAVLTLDRPGAPWISEFPQPVYSVGPGLGRYGYTRGLAHWLRAHIRDYDALIIHGCWQFPGPAAGNAARAAGIPYFIFPHGMLDPWFHRGAPLKQLKKMLYWPIERSVLDHAAAIFFTCIEEQERAIRGFNFSGARRVTPLGCETSEADATVTRAAFLARFPHLQDKRIVLFLGRLHRKKGVDQLLRAFAGVVQPPGVHLVIAGPAASSAYASELRTLANVCGPDRVTFTGLLTGNLKAGALAAADAFILPSHQENFGISVIEALASGVPVLISDQVNIWREIVQDRAGIAAPDTEAGARKLLGDWFALPPAAAEKMRSAARHCWNTRFRAEAASEKLFVTMRACAPLNDRAELNLHSIPA